MKIDRRFRAGHDRIRTDPQCEIPFSDVSIPLGGENSGKRKVLVFLHAAFKVTDSILLKKLSAPERSLRIAGPFVPSEKLVQQFGPVATSFRYSPFRSEKGGAWTSFNSSFSYVFVNSDVELKIFFAICLRELSLDMDPTTSHGCRRRLIDGKRNGLGNANIVSLPGRFSGTRATITPNG